MIDRDIFFNRYRKEFGALNQSQVDGINAILDEWETNYADKDLRWLAYCLATTYHETDKKMQPIEEYGKGRQHLYGKHFRYDHRKYTDTDNIFYGRGFVQLTWYENYERAGAKLGIDFIHNPEKVMELDNAAKIMFLGMTEGWFTGKVLSTYFNERRTDPINARAIINGMDRANLITRYYNSFIKCLTT